MSNFSDNRRGCDIFILAFLLVSAAMVRAPGLGRWCFTIDEYYFYNSVSYILDKGFPQFPGGGYYIRGLLVQYLVALPSLIFTEKEFAARIVPFISGVLSVPVFYLICRRFLPLFPAFLCSLILLFSSWHIEISRYARMYAPFQFAFLSFIYYFHSGYFSNKRTQKYICWFIALLSVFIYEASIFLPFILLLPILIDETPSNSRTIESLLVFSGLIIINYLVIGINYRDIGVMVDRFPPEFVFDKVDIDTPFSLPEWTLLKIVFKSVPLIFMYFILVLGGACLYYKEKKKATEFWENVSILVAVIMPLMCNYGFMLFLLLLIFVSNKNIFNRFLEERRYWIAYFLTSMIFWIVVGLFLENGFPSGRILFLFLKKMFLSFFGYPLIYDKIVLPFSKVTPYWGTVVAFGLLASIVHYLFSKCNDSRGILLLILLICILLVSILNTQYSETRYSYFYFPLLYIIVYMELVSFRDFAVRNYEKYR